MAAKIKFSGAFDKQFITMAIGDINHCNRKIGMVLVEVFQSIMAMRAGVGVKQIDFIIGNFFRCYGLVFFASSQQRKKARTEKLLW